MAGNKQVDPTQGNAAALQGNIAIQVGLLSFFILLGCVVGWCLRSTLPRHSRRFARRVTLALAGNGMTEEERQRRKAFVDENLKITEWGTNSKSVEERREENVNLPVTSSTYTCDDRKDATATTRKEDGQEEIFHSKDAKEIHNDTVESHEKDTALQNTPEARIQDQVVVAAQECSICLTDLVQGDMVTHSTNPACSHIFHHACVYPWMLRKSECPMCRNVFLVEAAVEENDVALRDLEDQSAVVVTANTSNSNTIILQEEVRISI